MILPHTEKGPKSMQNLGSLDNFRRKKNFDLVPQNRRKVTVGFRNKSKISELKSYFQSSRLFVGVNNKQNKKTLEEPKI